MMNGWNDLKNTVFLSVAHTDSRYDSRRSAHEAAERLIQAAGLIPAGDLIGWQMELDASGEIRFHAFSGGGGSVTSEDFGWIFRRCASVSPASSGAIGDLRQRCGRVYVLREKKSDIDPLPQITNDYMLDDEPYERRDCDELFSKLVRSGAVVRTLAFHDAGVKGMVLIGLSGEMPLSMRTMLSMCFPNTAAEELTEPISVSDMPRLSGVMLFRLTSGLLTELIAAQPKEPDVLSDEPLGDDDAEMATFDEDVKDESGGETPPELIEDMGLSVRAYNCLKRAGVHTVAQLREMSGEELARVRSLGRKCIAEIGSKLKRYNFEPAPTEERWPDPMAELDGLIGLNGVKEQAHRIAALARMKRDMQGRRQDLPIVLNMEFVGNPGTAKTTVARVLAAVFCEMGLLSSAEPVEVGRSDLVAEYVGQTAVKVKSVFQRAKGRLLFIDEAYSLADGGRGDFGGEAITAIVQEMENRREDTIVVFAGYPDEMAALFSENPGLRSRVPFRIEFPDYDVAEMIAITVLEAQKRGFSVAPDATKRIADLCERAEGGNGRFCRNLAERAILSYAARVYADDETASQTQKDFILRPEDFDAPARLTSERAAIGFIG